ncbi:helix-turn-helix transcriptional regulator [Sphingobacterium hotanense]|uniref:Helix-turn-helix transcriptional regulator n=1 Tax=Sphingobacterium hotanense TaxID=649196 RepID=A0ABT7NMA7_9SPHI|nr:helix-turn-helix transcriptional regulator [Sphingobacterium hotanense]
MLFTIDAVTIKDIKSQIAHWCQILRKQHNETQISLARKLNVSHKTIYNLEKGTNFTIDTLLKVLQHFDRLVLINKFLSGQIEQETEKSDINLY